ncbi:ABC transporter substrate-binding protein [Paenibacillus hodogayensis]|uniref:ABC transporter substrate-binding protein n=1 Tax=Paenibacillus hodogayensis TaxID=279208 RepID=A0ABV5W044_9BACL
MVKKKAWTNWLAAVVVASVLVTGCSRTPDKEAGSPDAGKQVEQKGPQQGGELTFALAGSPRSMDPHGDGSALGGRVQRAMFDSLVILVNNEVKPWLATEWSVSPDGKSYTFKLRKDVKFHDGTPFTAQSVKENFDRIYDPNTKAGVGREAIGPYASSEVLDEHTLKVNLKDPYSPFLTGISQFLIGNVSPQALEKIGAELGKVPPAGTGPFKFVKWTENTEIALVKNPDYKWAPEGISNKGPAYLDKLTFKIVPEEASRIGSVMSGEVLAGETVPPQNVVSLQNDSKLQIIQTQTGGLPFTLFINQKREPWNELKARQALQLAIDVDSIVKTLYLGTYERAWSPLSPSTLGYSKSLENTVKPDVKKANELLDELGWVRGADGIRAKDGKKLSILYVESSPNREKRNDIAAIIQQQLKQIGVSVEVEITKDAYTTVITKGKPYDIFGNSTVSPDPDRLRFFYHSQVQNVPGDQRNIPGLADPEIDKLIDKGSIESDKAKREQIYKELQQAIINKAVIIPIYVFPYTVAASKSVHGLVFDSPGYPFFNDVYISK